MFGVQSKCDGGDVNMNNRLNRTGHIGSRTGVMPRIQDSSERAKEPPQPPSTLPEFDEDGVTGSVKSSLNEGEDAAKQAEDDPTASAAG
jgi:hypothetical protein